MRRKTFSREIHGKLFVRGPAAAVSALKALLLFGLIANFPAHAGEDRWTQWPVGREDYEPSCQVPPGFQPMPPVARYFGSAPLSLNERFRSEDGSAEFAVTAISPRGLPPTAEARAIPLPLLPGERVASREPERKSMSIHGTRAEHYHESIAVVGPENAYTRYFSVELSTSDLPLASSMLWEFKVKDEKARKRFQSIYREFKERVNLGED